MDKLDLQPIVVELTREEYAEASLRALALARSERSGWPFAARVIGYLRVLVLPVLVVVGLKAFHPSATDSYAAGFFLVLLIAAIGVYAWLSQSGYLWRWLPRQDGATLRRHAITLDEKGLTSKSELIETHIGWNAIKQVDDHRGFILVFLDRASAIPIPRRAFPNSASADRFVAALRSHIPIPQAAQNEQGPSPKAKWMSRIVLGLIGLLILFRLVEWIAAGP